MLQITIPAVELYDEKTERFIELKEQTLQLEHSLVSLSKWESKWCKAFLGRTAKTDEEILDYVKCMTITQNVNPDIYKYLTEDNFKQINKYIEAPMTATTFVEDKTSKGSREVVTSELIYFWMISLNIPFDPCQKWHLNRLLALIRVCNVKNAPPKRRSKRDVASQYAALNAARKRQLNTKG